MLPITERLRRSNVFQRAYQARKGVSGQIFTLYVLPRLKVNESPKIKLPLVGFVVSRKVCKSACQRNRAKRRIREAYRNLRNPNENDKHKLFKYPGALIDSLNEWYALVWVVNEKALSASWQEICKRIESSLIEANKRYAKKKMVLDGGDTLVN